MAGGSGGLVRMEERDGVAVVVLDDPDKRNMLSDAMVSDLLVVLDQVEGSATVGAMVVTGAPPAFCAGASLGNLGRAGEGARREGGAGQAEGLRGIYEAFLRVSRSPLPTVAAVNGAAVGAGMNLALACDVRVVAESAHFDTRFLELGLHPGGGHTWMLQRAVGHQTALAMVLFGQVLRGPEAAARGLAWSCHPDGEVVTAAVELAARAASAPPELARRVKRTLREVATIDDHAAAVDTELEAQVWSLAQPWFAERLAAVQQRVSGGPKS